MNDKNKNLFEKSQQFIPGGVNSPVRAFSAVGGTPIFFKKGLGSKLWDENNKEYIDYINSWGPMILGHAHPEILDIVEKISKASLANEGANIISTNTFEISSATSSSHCLFMAITPPKADKLSALNACL